MKTITTTLTATLFSLTAAGVSAADVYQGLAEGNPDLSSQPAGIEDGFGVSATAARRRQPDRSLPRPRRGQCGSVQCPSPGAVRQR